MKDAARLPSHHENPFFAMIASPPLSPPRQCRGGQAARLHRHAAHSRHKWHVHDGDRPQPPVVTPGKRARASGRRARPTPSCSSTARTSRKWTRRRRQARAGRSRTATSRSCQAPATSATKDEFGDCQLHLELATPSRREGDEPGPRQQRRLLLGRYEIQVLDSLREPDLRRRPGRRALRPVPAAGERLAASPASGRPTTSSSTRAALRRTASSQARATSPSSTTACSSTTHASSSAPRGTGGGDLHSRTPRRARSAAGPRQPGALPQHLDPRAPEPWPRGHRRRPAGGEVMVIGEW